MSVKGFFRAIWQFCSFLFWPQWGRRQRNNNDIDADQT